ncbi:unnamed protein product [Parnassius mnemosyne]|uniref:Uncharacterized protein n=1 Tax=Parnassius mnemosyne TaxID=213953 RepID=A0AAV1KTT1_9NEOP
MSGVRGKYLVELCKQKDVQQTNHNKICEIIQDWNQEKVSSPVPDDVDTIMTPQFMSMFEDVFEGPIEQHEDEHFSSTRLTSPSQSTQNQIIKDVNLHITEPDSPFNYSACLATDVQKPSPMTSTPQSVEHLFSISVENYESDYNECTPMPSPYCDFSKCSQSADETLIPTTIPEDDVSEISRNILCSNPPSLIMPLGTLCNETHSVSDINPLSVSSTATSNDWTSYESSGTKNPLNRRSSKKRSDKGRRRIKHVEDWVATKRKRLCNTGQEYISRRGKVKEARKMKPICSYNCRLQCRENFSEEIRLELFTKFWGTGSHVKQWQLISKYVFQKRKKLALILKVKVFDDYIHCIIIFQ